MFYIVGIFHLSQYLGDEFYLNNNVYGNSIMWSCLGTFSLISGYLIGRKYNCETWGDVMFFYKKRVVRFYPLFFLSAILLYSIGFNNLEQTINSLLGLAPFLKPRPLTLWYISMIMVFYFITPFVLRGVRVKRSLFLIVGFVVLSRFIDIDYRFIFNLFFYFIGICSSNITTTEFFNKIKIAIMDGGGADFFQQSAWQLFM
jgi:peptidoglycan/LPS O-acetylase OafA/YrhL